MMIKCPKCGGPCEDVVLNLEEPAGPLSPKEYVKQMTEPQMMTLEMKYYQHEIRCQHCNYKKEFTAR